MPVTPTEKQITWSAANFTSITGPGNATSDVMSLSATHAAGSFTCRAQMTTGTPTEGDKVEFWLLGTCGDPDAAASPQYPTDEADGQWLCTVDLYACQLKGRATGIKTVNLPAPLASFKLYAKTTANFDAGDVARVSACFLDSASS